MLGPNVAEVIAELLAVNVLHRLRSAQGIIRLADKHSVVSIPPLGGHLV
jgi:hypothetical protein